MPETAQTVQEMEWVDQLLQKTLPSISSSGSVLLGLLSESTPSFQDMSDILRHDPVLALTLLNKANLQTRSNESLVKTLSQAISLLGTDYLQDLLQNTPPPERATIPAVIAYNKALTISFFSAHLAQYVAQTKIGSKGEEYYWYGLLYGLPMWLLWRYTPKKMQAWQDRLEHSFSMRKTLETKIFGGPFANIWKRIHQDFALPEVITDTPVFDDIHNNRLIVRIARHSRKIFPPVKPTDRDELLLLNHPGFIVAICNLIAFQGALDFYSAVTQRLIQCLSVYLEQPLKDTVRNIHKIAVKSARQHPIPGGCALVAHLIAGPKPLVENEEDESPVTPAANVSPSIISTPKAITDETPVIAQIAPAEAAEEEAGDAPKAEPAEEPDSIHRKQVISVSELAKPATKPESTPDNRQMRQPNQDLYIEMTQIMLRSPAQFKDVAALMNAAAQCITHGVGLRTCVVALINTNRTRLKGYFASGTSDRPQLGKIDVDLSSASLISKIMEKPSSIWIKPGSSDKVKKMIPDDFRKVNQTMDFFLTSCFVKTRPLALFYADAGIDALPLTEYEYECFKHVCSATSQVLYYFAQRNQKK